MEQDLGIRPDILKPLEENIAETPDVSDRGKVFLSKIPITQEITARINKWTQQSFCTAREWNKEMAY